MGYADLVRIFFERSAALQGLWTLYVVILGGLLAFSALRKEHDRASTLLITVLFAIFAFKNLGGIRDITFQRFAVLEAIRTCPRTPAELAMARVLDPTLEPPSWEAGRTTHVVADLLVVAALWTMELRRRRKVAAAI